MESLENDPNGISCDVNSTKIEPTTNGPNSGFKSMEVTLAWKNIHVSPPNTSSFKFKNLKKIFHKSSSQSTPQPAKKEKIIDDVSGIAEPRELLAIMGSSGSGKTTLLNVLNFRNRGSLKIAGEIKINGNSVNSVEKIAALSGYVQQDDLFVGTLTVKEHLLFQAMLRMDRSTDKKQKLDRIEEVLHQLDLKKRADYLIGNTSQGQNRISGGERRRLAFASEILTNPSVLFCDEPTSGLDAYMALSIIETMKNLAKLGKTIIFTVHQPSSDVFEMFDKICFIAEGRLAFIGYRNEAYTFFESLGYISPENYNPADYFIKVLSISPLEEAKSRKELNSIVNAFDSSDIHQELMKKIEKNTHSVFDVSSVHTNSHYKSFKASSLVQIRWLFWRNLIDSFRNPLALRVLFLQTLIMAIIYGLVYLRLNLNQEGVQNINGVLFICLLNCSYGTLFGVINTFPKEIPIFIREHQNGIYKVLPYYISKILVELPNYIVMPLLFTSIFYWMTNLNNDLIRFLIFSAIIIAVSQVVLAYGQFLSVVIPSNAAATDIAAPVTLPFMIFSGYLLNNESIPKYFLWIKYLSWFGYANEALVINQWKGVKNITCDTDPSLCFLEGETVIDYFNMDIANFDFDCWMLLYLFCGWRALSYLALLIKSYKR